MDIVAFLTARFHEEYADAVAAQEADPAPWRPDTNDGASTGLRSGHGAGLVIAADDEALWDCEGSHMLCMAATTARHVARWNPARVLAEVEAKRKLMNQAAAMVELAADTEAWFLLDMADSIRRHLAAPYVGHPDHNPTWRTA